VNESTQSRTEAVLEANKDSGRGSLIGYFPVGYPNLDDSIDAAIAMCKSGVDVLELGVPYSDPVMDGPVIQEATMTALANGFKLSQIFEAVERITAAVDTPVLVMTYWNPVSQYGVEKFAAQLKAAGGAGLITPDLVPEEAAKWLSAAEHEGLDRVFLAAPTSTEARVKTTCEASQGFVYAVSTMGITGARADLDAKAREVVANVRSSSTSAKTCVGIGISTAQQVAEVNEYSDGAIVGSAFIKAYSEGGLAALSEKVQELTSALAR
jgi:tryptophan synthase alpha chain